ncbi:MAG: hypothetical protein ACUVTL_09495 [Thermoproteota archaeon]
MREESRCMLFCPKGVFEILERKVVVANPNKCVSGCSACEPICPPLSP